MSPPRALIVVENLPVPTDRRVWQEALALQRNGWSVSIICPQGPGASEPFLAREGVEIHRFRPRPARGGAASYLIEYMWALFQIWRFSRRLSRASSFDVAQACNPPDLLFFPLLFLRRKGTRFIFDHHDLVPELYESRYGSDKGLLHSATRLFERLTFRVADIVTSTNESYRSLAISRGKKSPDDVFVVRNAPDLSRFAPTLPDESLKRGRTFLLAYAGAMGPQDGLDCGLQALAALKEHRQDWFAVLGGDGEVRSEVLMLVSKLGLDDYVDVPGWLEDDALVSLLSTADVCLAPEPSSPLNDRSTLVKIAEYMAMSKPVACFDLFESRVTAGGAAAYASPNDTGELARVLSDLLDDPGRRAEMGRIGRERVSESLSWDSSERELLKAYAAALSRRTRS